MTKFPTLYRDWLRPLNKEKGWLFELPRREGGFGRHSLNCTECHAICWSINYKITFVLVNKLFFRSDGFENSNYKKNYKKNIIWIIVSLIILSLIENILSKNLNTQNLKFIYLCSL